VAAVLEQRAKRWTYEEYYKLEDDQHYEVIDGRLLIVGTPDIEHQDWVGNLSILVTPHVRTMRLGRVLVGPVDVVLDAENVIQPDLVFVGTKNLGIIEKRAIFGSPDLLVELLSPSSVRRDRHTKMNLYSRFGVKEYWIGDPANHSLEIFKLVEGHYELHCSADEKGELHSLVLTGLKFDLAEIQS
jgi:Uma2 family endonuclease